MILGQGHTIEVYEARDMERVARLLTGRWVTARVYRGFESPTEHRGAVTWREDRLRVGKTILLPDDHLVMRLSDHGVTVPDFTIERANSVVDSLDERIVRRAERFAAARGVYVRLILHGGGWRGQGRVVLRPHGSVIAPCGSPFRPHPKAAATRLDEIARRFFAHTGLESCTLTVARCRAMNGEPKPCETPVAVPWD